MHIIGTLKLPTCLRRYVMVICGMYWTAARTAAKIPLKMAQLPR